jgi:hypothetical protein
VAVQRREAAEEEARSHINPRASVLAILLSPPDPLLEVVVAVVESKVHV